MMARASPPSGLRPTALERVLSADARRRRPTPIDALVGARRAWLRGENLDMGRLAEELGTSRATLYRWVGDRDRLLGEVLWSLASDTLRLAGERVEGSGADYVADVLDWFMTAVTYHPSMRRFLERDPEYALRVLTAQQSVVRARMTTAIRQLVAEQQAADKLVPALDCDALAYLIVRICESFMYSDLIAGAEPDIPAATTAIRILLHARPGPPPHRPPAGRSKRTGRKTPAPRGQRRRDGGISP
jgi:AcrR family transcriptional regulator